MNRNLVMRLLAAGPLLPLLAKVAPVAAPLENELSPPSIAEGTRYVQVSLSGFASDGQFVTRWIDGTNTPVVESLIPNAEAEIPGIVRGLPQVQGLLAKAPYLDRINLCISQKLGGEWTEDMYHVAVDPAKLPVGWTADMTGKITPFWESQP